MLHRFIGIANVLIPVCLDCFGYGCETQLNSIAQVGIEFAVVYSPGRPQTEL